MSYICLDYDVCNFSKCLNIQTINMLEFMKVLQEKSFSNTVNFK